MAKGFEVTGIIHTIGETQSFGQNGFTKREFVVKLTGEGEKEEYPNYVALELIKDKCALMDSYQPGDEVKVQFNLNGRLWSAPGKPEKCFTSLQAWRVERMDDVPQFAQQQPAPSQAYNDFDDDVPF